MKALKIRYIFAYLFFVLLLVGCQKDEEGFIPTNELEVDQKMFVSDIFGVVTSNNQPVGNASVVFQDQVTFTDEYGVYTFSDVKIGNQHNVVKIEKEGFFDGARVFRSSGSSTQYQRTELQGKIFDRSFNSADGGTITKDRASLIFPAGSIIVESSEELYSGEVLVAMEMIDPGQDNIAQIMPGDLTGREEDNTLTILQSFGMVGVELQSSDGQKLQIASGKFVDVVYEVNDLFLDEAPGVIDLWTFNDDLGLWIKEGSASLQGNKYTGSVSHFSWWNFDLSVPSIVLTGKLVSNLSPLKFVWIEIKNDDNKGGHGSTDSEGVFSGRIEAGVELTMSIYSMMGCSTPGLDPIYQETIGPFNIDTDLGELNLNLNADDVVIFKGTAVDCDFEPVQKGRVVILRNFHWNFYPFTDGVVDLSFPVCGGFPFDFRLVDTESGMQTFESTINSAGEIDLMEVVICDELANHVAVDNLINGAYSIIDSLGFYNYIDAEGISHAQILGYSFLSDEAVDVNVSWELPEELEIRSYDLNYFKVRLQEGNDYVESFNMENGQAGQIEIQTIEPQGNEVSKVSGKYSVDCTDEISGLVRTITGSFILDYFE